MLDNVAEDHKFIKRIFAFRNMTLKLLSNLANGTLKMSRNRKNLNSLRAIPAEPCNKSMENGVSVGMLVLDQDHILKAVIKFCIKICENFGFVY